MPMRLEGSCRCGTVSFQCDSHTPAPYQLCYCSICRKTAGGGGYAINLMGINETLRIQGRGSIAVYRAAITDEASHCEISTGERNFCKKCASALWLYDPTWPELVHPFASIIDTPLPVATTRCHIMLHFKPSWVPVDAGPRDVLKDLYPDESIEDWHRSRGLWVD